jgi:hypothetical protein
VGQKPGIAWVNNSGIGWVSFSETGGSKTRESGSVFKVPHQTSVLYRSGDALSPIAQAKEEEQKREKWVPGLEQALPIQRESELCDGYPPRGQVRIQKHPDKARQ